MYEKKVLNIATELAVNKCPHCNQQFVILATFDDGEVMEQVGPRVYCFLCGKRFNEKTDNNNPK